MNSAEIFAEIERHLNESIKHFDIAIAVDRDASAFAEQGKAFAHVTAMDFKNVFVKNWKKLPSDRRELEISSFKGRVERNARIMPLLVLNPMVDVPHFSGIYEECFLGYQEFKACIPLFDQLRGTEVRRDEIWKKIGDYVAKARAFVDDMRNRIRRNSNNKFAAGALVEAYNAFDAIEKAIEERDIVGVDVGVVNARLAMEHVRDYDVIKKIDFGNLLPYLRADRDKAMFFLNEITMTGSSSEDPKDKKHVKFPSLIDQLENT